jgi:hypothetical protein
MNKYEVIEKQSYNKVVGLIKQVEEKHWFFNIGVVRSNIRKIKKSLSILEVGATLNCESEEELDKVQMRAAQLQGRLKGYNEILQYCKRNGVQSEIDWLRGRSPRIN